LDISPILRQPLVGLRVMVTRPSAEEDSLAEHLRRLGAEVVRQPAIVIGPPADWSPVDAAIDRLEQFDWLVFLSANGVRYLLDRMTERGKTVRLGSIRLAAIGPGTAEALARRGLSAERVPEPFCAEALADALARDAAGRRCLLARGSRGREVLAQQLSAAGAAVEQIVVYTSVDVERPAPEIVRALAADQIDWITVTSSAIARSLARMFGKDLRRAHLASISPLTSQTLVELGYPPAVEAADATMDGLATAIRDFVVLH